MPGEGPGGEKGSRGSWRMGQGPQAGTQGAAPRLSEAQGVQENSPSEPSLSFVLLFIHPVSLHTEGPPSVPGTVLGPGAAATNKTRPGPSPHAAHGLGERDRQKSGRFTNQEKDNQAEGCTVKVSCLEGAARASSEGKAGVSRGRESVPGG